MEGSAAYEPVDKIMKTEIMLNRSPFIFPALYRNYKKKGVCGAYPFSAKPFSLYISGYTRCWKEACSSQHKLLRKQQETQGLLQMSRVPQIPLYDHS